MNTRPYHQSADQRERERLLRNDRANTFAGRAQAEADEIQGRWAQEHKATVIGTSDATAQYPKLPSGPWADPVQIPPEPALGFSVEDHEPVGTIPEVQASIDAIGDPATGSHQPAPSPRHDERGFVGSPLAGADERSIVCDPSDDDVEPVAPANPTPKPKPTETR
jgi:hypothetical protein